MAEGAGEVGVRTSASSVRVRSADELAYCEEESVPRRAFQREGATRFVVADFRPRSERPEDIQLGRTAADAVDRLLRDYMIRVALEGEAAVEQARAAKNLEVYRLRCVIRDATAVCPLGKEIHTGPIEARVELPKAETGSFCARASLTAKGWPAMGSGNEESRSVSVLELGSLELPQVVAGDVLGLTLFVGGLHFYKRDDYPRALRLFRSASEKLRTDSRSAADLLQVMGLTEYWAGRFDNAADFLSRCESLATGDSDTWWGCRMGQVGAHILASHLPRAQVLAEEALRRSRAVERRGAEANTLKSLGDLALRVDELKEAKRRYEEALPLYRAIGARLGEASTLSGLGDLADAEGHYDDADKWYQQARSAFEFIGNRFGAARTDWRQGLSLARRGNARQAREVLTRAHRAFIDLGVGHAAVVVLKSLDSLKAEGPQP